MEKYITPQTVALALMGVLALVGTLRAPQKFAVIWALILPIEVVNGVPEPVFDGLRYAGAAWLCIRVPADLGWSHRPLLRNLAVLMSTLAVIRAGMGLVNHDGPNVRFGIMLATGALLGYQIVLRTSVHRSVVAGYLAGVAVSASVSLTQSLHIEAIAPANLEGQRYPGLSVYTSVLSWHLATALIVSAYLLATSGRGTREYWISSGLMGLYTLGLLTNGAQGGLVGVGAAGVAIAWHGRAYIHRRLRFICTALAGTAFVLLAIVVVLGADIPSLTDYDTNLGNERARVESWQDGLRALADHPVTGTSSAIYLANVHPRVMPHLLPLESGATAGVGGFLASTALVGYLAWLGVRGPPERRGTTIAGHGVLIAMLVNVVAEPQGPFTGVARTVPLFLAVFFAAVPRKDPAGGSPDSLSVRAASIRGLPPAGAMTTFGCDEGQ